MACTYTYNNKEYTKEEIKQELGLIEAVKENYTEDFVQLLSNYGIKVTSLDHYSEMTGKDYDSTVQAVADLANTIIAVKDKDVAISNLPEEVGHLVIPTYRDTYEYKRAMRYVEDTQEFQNQVGQYKEAYKGDINKVKEEILGQLLGKHIVKKVERKGNRSLLTMLKRLFEKFMNLFSNTKPLTDFLDKSSSEFVQGTISLTRSDEEFFSLSEEVKLLRQIELALKGRKKSLRKRGLSTEKVDKEISAIQKEDAQGLVKFLQFVSEDMDQALQFVDEVRAGTKTITPRKLLQLREFISYYEPYLNDLENFSDFNPGFTNTDKQAISNIISTLVSGFRTVERFRNHYSKEETEKLLRELAIEDLDLDQNATNDEITEALGFDLIEESKVVHKDSNMLEFWFGSMRDATDQISRMVFSVVLKAKRIVFRNTLDFGQRVTRKAQELGVYGKDYSWMYEKDPVGGYTGNYINIINYRGFGIAKKQFYQDLNRRYNLSEDPDIRETQLANMLESNLRKYKREIGAWYSFNTEIIPNVEKRIAFVKSRLPDAEFQIWYDRNTNTYTLPNGNTKIYYKGELTQPNPTLYSNPQYNKLTDNQKQFLEYVVEQKSLIDAKLPGIHDAQKAVQIRETTLQIFLHRNKELFSRLGKNIKDEFLRTEDDDIFGDIQVERPDGSTQKHIPIYYTRRLEDTNLITTDALSALVAYKDMAENYVEMSKRLPELELIQESIGNRKLIRRGKQMTGDKSVAYKQVEKFLDMNVFGIQKVGGDYKLPNGKVVKASKIVNKFLNYVRANNLAWNVFTTLSNYIQSGVYSKIEDMVGQFTTNEAKLKAEAEFWKQIHGAIAEMNNPIKNNKLNLLMQHSGLYGDTRNIFGKLDVSKLTRRAINSGLYGSYELVDFRTKSKVLLAHLFNLKKFDGKYITYSQLVQQTGSKEQAKQLWSSNTNTAYTALRVDDGKIVSSDPDLDVQTLDRIYTRAEYVANTIDGKLTPLDQGAAHQHFLGQILTLHRSWLFSGLQRRLKSKGVNYATGLMDEGYYVSTFKFLRDTFFSKERVRSLKELSANWQNLEPYQRAAVSRTMYEMISAWIFMGIAIAINNADAEDDEDSYSLDFAAYLSNRALLEVGAFMPIPPLIVSELSQTIKDPLVPMRYVEMMFDVADLFSSEEIERGTWEGFTKREKFILRLVPGIKGLSTLRDPSGANNYLKNRPLKMFY